MEDFYIIPSHGVEDTPLQAPLFSLSSFPLGIPPMVEEFNRREVNPHITHWSTTEPTLIMAPKADQCMCMDAISYTVAASGHLHPAVLASSVLEPCAQDSYDPLLPGIERDAYLSTEPDMQLSVQGAQEFLPTTSYSHGIVSGNWMCPVADQLLGYDTLPDLQAESDHANCGFQEHNSGENFAMREPCPLLQQEPLLHHMQSTGAPITHFTTGRSTGEPFELDVAEPPLKLQKTWLPDLVSEFQPVSQDMRGLGTDLGTTRGISIETDWQNDYNQRKHQIEVGKAAADHDNPISIEPQSVAARHRRKKISERVRSLEMLIPGGTKMDTATMLDEAIRYVKFLQLQVRLLEGLGDSSDYGGHAKPNLNKNPVPSPLVLSEELQELLFRKKCCVASIRQCPPEYQQHYSL